MGKPLPDHVKPARKHIKRWDGALKPIAMRHSVGDKEVSRYVHDHGTRIDYENPDTSFSLSIQSHGKCENPGQVVYARQVAPYWGQAENGLNIEACSDVARFVAGAARTIGYIKGDFKTSSYVGIGVAAPAVAISGRFSDDIFNDVAKLVVMTDDMIDFRFREVDQTMVRPFHYALVPIVGGDARGASYFKEVESVEDLSGASHVLTFGRKPEGIRLGEGHRMLYGDRDLAKLADANSGKIMTPDEFARRG